MKIIKKIKAFFCRNDEPVEMDLVAAEIRQGKAFLHTKGEEPITYLVRANDIEIRLNKGVSISDMDILTVNRKALAKDKKLQKEIAKAEAPRKPVAAGVKTGQPAQAEIIELDRFKKRKFVVSVYPDEYDQIMASIKEYGYKRADFLMACVHTATKGTMEKAHKKIVKTHREIVLEQQALIAKQIAEMEQNGGQTG